MSRTYLSNYWTLYKEFINTFKNIKYKEITIALLFNFYQHIDDELKIEMEKEDFLSKLNITKLSQMMIQPFFDDFLNKLKTPLSSNNNGKILINSDYIRIPQQILKKHFDPKHTIILSRSKNPHINEIPNEYIEKYAELNNEVSQKISNEIDLVFKSKESHPIFGNEFFQKTILNRIPFIVKAISTALNIFDQLSISTIIVGTTEDVNSRALSIAGSMHGIKSICLQHGALMGEEAFMPVFTSLVGVYGEYEKKWYIQRGVNIDRISELGHPKYDEIFTKISTKKESFLQSFQFDPKKLTLLVITGPHSDHKKFEKLIKNISSSKRFQIIIKPHPWEIGKGKYKQYIDLQQKYHSIKVYTSRENNLYDLLSHVDGVISTMSTVVLESLLINKPVFIYNFLNSNRPYNYYDKLDKYLQNDPDLLYKILHDYFNCKKEKEIFEKLRNEYISDCYIDGSSGKKLFDLCQINT